MATLDPDRRAVRLRAVRHGTWAAGFVMLAFTALRLWVGFAGYDSHAYWAAWSRGLYGAAPRARDAYLYSPAFAEALWPMTRLPWPAFAVLWSAGLAVAALWLVAPLPTRWRLPLLLLAVPEVIAGNVYLIFGVVLALGFRSPALWAFPVCTKLTPGLGPVWFAVRREWRAFGVALAATGVVVAVSFVVDPMLWREWLDFLAQHAGYAADGDLVPTVVRLPVAFVVTVWGALTNRRWALCVAMPLASPVLGFNAFVGCLFALPRVVRSSDRSDARVQSRADVIPAVQ